MVPEVPTVLKAIGFGIDLQPNAARELIELGLGEALAETAIETAQGDSLARTMPLKWTYEFQCQITQAGRIALAVFCEANNNLSNFNA